MQYEFLDHTSEAKFRAYGKTLEEAFENAAKAMFAIIIDPEEVEGKIKKTVEVDVGKEDKKALLYDFLEELIILQDSEGFMLHDIEVEIEGSKLRAVCKGDSVKNYITMGDVKAATYADMEISQKGKNWTIQVVVDV
jgi:SHS2 domain-containing protein